MGRFNFKVHHYRLQKNGESYDPSDYVESVQERINTDVRKFNSTHHISN